MAWNNDTFDKDGYRITAGSEDQDVFDISGDYIGFFNECVIEDGGPGKDTIACILDQ